MSLGGNTTYSFEDITGAYASPIGGIVTFDGIGAGSINIAMDQEMTAHNIAADGVVMVTKKKGEPGTITVQVQQTSPFHRSMIQAYTAIKLANAASWASAGMTIRAVTMGITHIATGVSFAKIPDTSYQGEGQMVSWTFKAADIQTTPA